MVLPLSPETTQQHSEMLAAELCVQMLGTLKMRSVVLAGDSTAALDSLRKMTTPARFAHRARCLQHVAMNILQCHIRFSLAKVPGAGPNRNPADPLARIQVFASTLVCMCSSPSTATAALCVEVKAGTLYIVHDLVHSTVTFLSGWGRGRRGPTQGPRSDAGAAVRRRGRGPTQGPRADAGAVGRRRGRGPTQGSRADAG
eukprot:gene15684-biopygen14277